MIQGIMHCTLYVLRPKVGRTPRYTTVQPRYAPQVILPYAPRYNAAQDMIHTKVKRNTKYTATPQSIIHTKVHYTLKKLCTPRYATPQSKMNTKVIYTKKHNAQNVILLCASRYTASKGILYPKV
jgi:hypothetical protein